MRPKQGIGCVQTLFRTDSAARLQTIPYTAACPCRGHLWEYPLPGRSFQLTLTGRKTDRCLKGNGFDHFCENLPMFFPNSLCYWVSTIFLIICLVDEPLIEHLKTMGPSSIDAEMRSLGPSGGGDVQLLEQFMLFMERQLHSRRDFEFTEAILGLFLKVSSLNSRLLPLRFNLSILYQSKEGVNQRYFLQRGSALRYNSYPFR